MLSEITRKTTCQIAQELRTSFGPPFAGGQQFPGSSARVTTVEAWLDLRRKADGPTRRKIDDAMQQGLTAVLSESATDPEVVCAHVRVLRLAAHEGRGLGKVHDDAKKAVLGAIQSKRFKSVKTSYGDAHAELLACVETLRLAPEFEFWLIQMCDTKYVTQGVSGCLGSGNEHWALSGVIQAAKLGDRSLALSLMRLFRMFKGRESLVWGRFGEARRNGAWSQEVFDQVSRSMTQIGQSCPSDPALGLEQEAASLQEQSRAKDEEIASLRQQLRHKDRLWQTARTEAVRAVREKQVVKAQVLSPLDRIQTIQTKQKALQAEYDKEFRQLEEIASLAPEDVQELKYEETSLKPPAPEGVHKTLLLASARSTQGGVRSIDSKRTKPKRANAISRAEQEA